MPFNMPNPFGKINKNKSNVVPFAKPSGQPNQQIPTSVNKPKQQKSLIQKAGLTLGSLGLFAGGGLGIKQLAQDLTPVSFEKEAQVEQMTANLQQQEQELAQVQIQSNQEVQEETADVQEIQNKVTTLEGKIAEIQTKFDQIKKDIKEKAQKIQKGLEDYTVDFEESNKQLSDQKYVARNLAQEVLDLKKQEKELKTELKTQNTELSQAKKKTQENIKRESNDVTLAQQQLNTAQILKINQERKTREAQEILVKTQQEIRQQKVQKEQEVAKTLEEGNQKILEAQQKLTQLVAQNQAKKEAAKNKLEQISQEEITGVNQLILNTFESFGVKAELIDTNKINQDQIIKLTGNQNGMEAATRIIQSQNPSIQITIKQEKRGERIVRINTGQ